MSFSAYPGYKDSGMAWLGAIPKHWLLYRSKNVFSERNIKALESDEQLTASQKYGVIPQKLFSELENQKVMQVILGRDILKKAEVNDFVISMRSFQGGLEFSSYSGAVSSAYVPLYANRELDNIFFKHLFKSVSFISALQNTSNLVRDGQALRYNNLVQLSLPFPSINEQRTIGAFLDHETARIDALIEEQQRLIELLKEKRQAVISHAVTKGLDPTVQMKDSGVEWLGEVPLHWVVGPLRWYATIQGGIAKGKDYEGRETVSLPYLRVANVQSGFVDLTEVKEISVLESEIERYSLRLGDVLMNEGGDNDKLGRGTVWQGQIEPCLHQNHVFAIRPNVLLLAEWLTAFTQCDQARSYFFLNSKQSTNLASISASNVMSLALPIPSISEQKEILSVLNQSRLAHEELVDLASLTVEFLKERRSALISAAVTGKIDVRGWQPPASASSPESAQEAV